MSALRDLFSRALRLPLSLFLLASASVVSNGCYGDPVVATPSSGDFSFGSVLGTTPSTGPLQPGVSGVDPLTVIAPALLHTGEHFSIRIGSTLRPGGSSFGSALLHVKDSPDNLLIGAVAFPSPQGQGVGDVWSLDIRGQVSPAYNAESKAYEVEIGLIDAMGQLGLVTTWSPTIVAVQTPLCPSSASCGLQECGIEASCGTSCGSLAGSCTPGTSCSAQGECLPVGAACPQAASCLGRECGIDPICGALSCGTCPVGQACSDLGACVPDSTTTSTDSSTTATDTDTLTTETTTTGDSSTQSDTASCAPPLVLCDDRCIDPKADPQHCGAANPCEDMPGAQCPEGELCSLGSCAKSCASWQILCNGRCIDPATDSQHCGAQDACEQNPGTICKSTEVCSQGECSELCPSWQVRCGNRCIDPQLDPSHCGAKDSCSGSDAGSVCAPSEVCSGGICRADCGGKQVACDGQCIDPKTDTRYCGAKYECEGQDRGQACLVDQLCADGSCSDVCSQGTIECDGRCIDPSSDPNYCGAKLECIGSDAGVSCTNGKICIDGTCKNPCSNAGEVMCSGTCINPQKDTQYCGASLDCQDANAGKSCGAGSACFAGVCKPVQCEDDTTRNVACGNCGTRQERCIQGQWANNGTCSSQGECAPGSSRSSGSCGNCGTLEQQCLFSCSWDNGSCKNEGDAPAQSTEVEKRACSSCSSFQERTRQADAQCKWQAWSAWGMCSAAAGCTPNTTMSESRACGDCGSQTRVRTCSDACDWSEWGQWSGCTGEGECGPNALPQTQTQNCGFCGKQSRSRQCTSACSWEAYGAWSACSGEGECEPGTTKQIKEPCNACGPSFRTIVYACTASCGWQVQSSGQCAGTCPSGSTCQCGGDTCLMPGQACP